MKDIEDTEDSVFIILEYMEGGELNGLVETTHPINEAQAKQLFYQIAVAVAYLHSNGIIHRDLKPENILLKTPYPDSIVKISDFGLSRFLDEENDFQRTVCGTPMYVAPEVLRRELYGYQADIWSLGVVLYFMLGRDLPFKHERRLSQTSQVTFCGDIWLSISEDAKDLVRRMLTVDVRERIKMDDLMVHPWIVDTGMLNKVGELLYGEHSTFAAYDSESDESIIVDSDDEAPPPKRSRTD